MKQKIKDFSPDWTVPTLIVEKLLTFPQNLKQAQYMHTSHEELSAVAKT